MHKRMEENETGVIYQVPPELWTLILESVPTLWLPIVARIHPHLVPVASHIARKRGEEKSKASLLREAVSRGFASIVTWLHDDHGHPWTSADLRVAVRNRHWSLVERMASGDASHRDGKSMDDASDGTCPASKGTLFRALATGCPFQLVERIRIKNRLRCSEWYMLAASALCDHTDVRVLCESAHGETLAALVAAAAGRADVLEALALSKHAAVPYYEICRVSVSSPHVRQWISNHGKRLLGVPSATQQHRAVQLADALLCEMPSLDDSPDEEGAYGDWSAPPKQMASLVCACLLRLHDRGFCLTQSPPTRLHSCGVHYGSTGQYPGWDPRWSVPFGVTMATNAYPHHAQLGVPYAWAAHHYHPLAVYDAWGRPMHVYGAPAPLSWPPSFANPYFYQ